MLTSSNDPRDIERAKALGVQEYLIKPVDLGGIREIARKVAEFASLRAAENSGTIPQGPQLVAPVA